MLPILYLTQIITFNAAIRHNLTFAALLYIIRHQEPNTGPVLVKYRTIAAHNVSVAVHVTCMLTSCQHNIHSTLFAHAQTGIQLRTSLTTPLQQPLHSLVSANASCASLVVIVDCACEIYLQTAAAAAWSAPSAAARNVSQWWARGGSHAVRLDGKAARVCPSVLAASNLASGGAAEFLFRVRDLFHCIPSRVRLQIARCTRIYVPPPPLPHPTCCVCSCIKKCCRVILPHSWFISLQHCLARAIADCMEKPHAYIYTCCMHIFLHQEVLQMVSIWCHCFAPSTFVISLPALSRGFVHAIYIYIIYIAIVERRWLYNIIADFSVKRCVCSW